MFTQIKTSKDNKEVVGTLTRRLNLGTENVIARIAFIQSLNTGVKLDIKDLKDHSGKEYSRQVLFGDNLEVYLGLICVHYSLHRSDKDVPKYIKLHIDHGLKLLNEELSNRPNVEGFDFLSEKILEAMPD